MLPGDAEYYTVGHGWTRMPMYDWPDGEKRFCPYTDQKSEKCYHYDELVELCGGTVDERGEL